MAVVVSIRSFVAGDLPAVLAIEQASFCSDSWSPDCFRVYMERFPEFFFVASIDETVVGYAVTYLSRGKAELASIAVLPDFRRHSVAKHLLDATIARAAVTGVRELWLMVRTDNLPAQKLYQSAGFTRTRTVANYYRDGSSAWRMGLPLATLLSGTNSSHWKSQAAPSN